MAIIQDRLSTITVPDEYLPPEERNRASFLLDFEGGPIAFTDTSGGMNYQTWALTYDGLDIILTPEITGSAVVVLSVAGCEQISFCFDKNARPSVVYILGTSAFLYWYDTTLGYFTTTEFTGVHSAMLSLDDKRELETANNDILFWYTKEVAVDEFNLYHRRQRDRFLNEILMASDTFPYVYKVGMHKGLRGQLALTSSKVTGISPPPILPPSTPLDQANLDFELGDVYWIKTGDFAITPSDPHGGSWSAILDTNPANSSTLTNTVFSVVVVGNTISVSCWVKGTTATNIRLGFRFYNGTKTLLTTLRESKAVTTGWTQVTYQTVVPPNSVYMRVFVEDDSTSGIVSIDDFTFTGLDIFYEVELLTITKFNVDLAGTTLFEIEK